MRVLLVDDEPIALRGMQYALRDEADITIVGTCEDGAAAIASIAELRPDLVFLDIQMPGLNGFDVIDAIGIEQMPFVIFVTAFDQHAVRAFDVHALDYVLKPVDPARFALALQRARQHRQPSAVAINGALQDLGLRAVPSWTRRIAIKHNGRIVLIDADAISRVDAAGNYVEIHADKVHLLREPISSLAQRLDPKQFARISRSSLVNVNQVRAIETRPDGDFTVVMRDDTTLAGSRRYRHALAALLG